MVLQDIALAAAGVIGAIVAIVHGVLTQRFMVQPFEAIADGRMTGAARRLVPILLHLSTFAWFLGGLALIAAIWFKPDVRLAIGLCVGAVYLYAVIGNFWGTRGRHPGWMLYAVAVACIVYALIPLVRL